jgi:hypothetical protein
VFRVGIVNEVRDRPCTLTLSAHTLAPHTTKKSKDYFFLMIFFALVPQARYDVRDVRDVRRDVKVRDATLKLTLHSHPHSARCWCLCDAVAAPAPCVSVTDAPALIGRFSCALIRRARPTPRSKGEKNENCAVSVTAALSLATSKQASLYGKRKRTYVQKHCFTSKNWTCT